jgi:hypothetical protein
LEVVVLRGFRSGVFEVGLFMGEDCDGSVGVEGREDDFGVWGRWFGILMDGYCMSDELGL